MYWQHTRIEYAKWWQYGYREMVREINKLESGYTSVKVTYAYDQPYIYFLYYQKTDPSFYQNIWRNEEIKRSERSFGKYIFKNIDWINDAELRNTLIIGTADEIPGNAANILKEIYFPDGTVSFRIVGT